jgi:hypothetical protein
MEFRMKADCRRVKRILKFFLALRNCEQISGVAVAVN